ncbi:MAG: ACT domain-containing protein [Candidatus Omnitrophota bacterium]
MNKPKKVTQLVVTTPDRAGMLAEVTGALAKENINIEAICAYGDEGEAIFNLVVDEPTKAQKALKDKGWEVAQEEAVILSLVNKAGALAKVAEKLKKDEVNLRYCYGTTEQAGRACNIVLKAIDNERLFKSLS